MLVDQHTVIMNKIGTTILIYGNAHTRKDTTRTVISEQSIMK